MRRAAGQRRAGAEAELESARNAADAARRLLAEFPALRPELRELLRNLDARQAVDLAGLPDPALRARLAALLTHLGLKASKSGTSFNPPSNHPPLLPQLAPVLAEDQDLIVRQVQALDADEVRLSTRRVTAPTRHLHGTERDGTEASPARRRPGLEVRCPPAGGFYKL